MTAEKLRKRLRIRQEQILTSSLSFGLLLCAAGMVATLLYLLLALNVKWLPGRKLSGSFA